MSEKIKKVPKLRFPEFTDTWEQCKLGEVVERITRKNKNLESDLTLSISAQEGLVSQKDFFNKQVAAQDLSNYYLIYNGEFAYNKSYSNGYPFGAIKRLDLYEKGVLSTLYIVFSLASNEVLSNYLALYYSTNRWYKDISERVAEGARNHGLLNIAVEDFFDIKIIFPKEKKEQEKIGNFFKSIDEIITIHQRKLENLKKQKKSLLQKMFPKNGSNFPEIRFPEFTDAWEQCKLGEVGEFSKGNGYTKNDLVKIGIPIVLYGQLYTNYETIISNISTFVELKENSIFSTGNELLIPASGETAEDIARASVIKEKNVILGGDLNIIKLNQKINSLFLAFSLSNGELKKELSSKAQGKSIVHLHSSEIKKVNFKYPSLKEQEKIGNFFKSIDEIITIHQRKLENLKKLKKGLLQQMFI